MRSFSHENDAGRLGWVLTDGVSADVEILCGGCDGCDGGGSRRMTNLTRSAGMRTSWLEPVTGSSTMASMTVLGAMAEKDVVFGMARAGPDQMLCWACTNIQRILEGGSGIECG